ncbi:MAG: response regulator, partial [Myxococcales bacterium]|nr:response regulator [Myxococcales bacterium]
DDGAGMDAETLERAFEPGFTTKGLGVGSGLGLASVRRIVEGSGGKLSLTSTLGKGTSVHLAWPRVIPAERRSTVVDREAPLVSRRGVALVIDDEPLIRLTVRSYLESFGYSVLEARDAMTTAEVLEANDRPLRLVISDVVIPGTSAVADVVARYPDVPILYMSGHGADWLVEHGYLPRGEELLAKPFTRAQLHARLATRLGAHLQLPATVLLVEDDELSRQAISELLTTDGYRVVGASKGRDALETCEREKLQIDAVVTDLGLPDMSGQRLSQHLRARFESCPVVFLSGQPRGAPQVQDAIAAPRTAFLQKPVQVTELITVIEELLRAP